MTTARSEDDVAAVARGSDLRDQRDERDEIYDSFLRAAARVSDGSARVTAPPLRPGTCLAGGRFELTATLGSGGMGVVYAVRDRVRGGELALKTLQSTDHEAFERLRSEFLVLHDLVHPNLVALGELLEDDGRCFFTMEWVRGSDFLGYVRPGHRLDLARLRAAAAQLVTGLGFLHSAGKVHRDIKPSNVLVERDRVVLLDFGLAASVGGCGIDGGTLGYMAPEQGRSTVGPAADWYALGVMLWEALTGAIPFVGTAAELIAAKRRGPPAVASEVTAAAPELFALAIALLNPDPAGRPPGAAIAEALGAVVPARAAMPRFVGRVGERAALCAAFAAAGAASKAVLVRGPSGIGKSALVAAFAEQLRERGALVLSDRCFERVALPFKGLHGVAAGLLSHIALDEALRAEVLAISDLDVLAAALPALAALLAERSGREQSAGPVRDLGERRARFFAAFAQLVRTVVARTPIAILIDDVPWADRDGLALLRHLVAQVPQRLLVVATAADGAAVDPQWAQGAEVVEIGPLLRSDAVAFGVALLGPDDHDVAAGLVEEAAGHPLHLAELVAHRRRHGGAISGWPPRLEDAIAARVAELPRASAQLLAAVVLAGAPLPQGLLGTAAGLDGAAWWGALGALRAAHLIRSAGAGAGDPIEPAHERVRGAVAAAVDPAQRRALHARLGALLAEHPLALARPELVADHLEAGGDDARALGYVETAAAQAWEALAFDRAAQLYRRALQLDQSMAGAGAGAGAGSGASANGHAILDGDRHRDSADRSRAAGLQQLLGQVCADAGRGGEAAAAFLAAAAGIGAGSGAHSLRRHAAEQLLRSGRIDDGIALLDQVLVAARLPTLSRRRWPVAAVLRERARLWLRKALSRTAGPPRQRVATAPGARAAKVPPSLHPSLHPSLPEGRSAQRLAACWSAVVGASLISPLRGAEFQARHLRLALAAGDARRIALGLAFEAGGAAVVGPPARTAHALLAQAESWACHVDEPLVWAYLDLARGSVAFLTGQWRRALDRCDAAERRLRDHCLGASWEIGTAQRMSLTALWHLGQIAELRRRLARALAEATRRNDLYAEIQMRTVLTPVVCLMDDRVDHAMVELEQASAGLPRRGITLQHWQLMQARALVALYRGDASAAVAILDRDTPGLRRGHLFRVHAVRMFTAYVEASALLAVAAAGGVAGARARHRAIAVQAGLAGRGGNLAAAELIAAQLAVLDRQDDLAIASYRRAIAGLLDAELVLVAISARWRLGQLLGGSAGDQLRNDAEAVLLAEGIGDPVKTVGLFVPVAR
jgi:eukaryotic-like serine/threonine-protein kinase